MKADEDFPPYEDFRTSLDAAGNVGFVEEFTLLVEKNLRSGFWEDLLDIEDFFHFGDGYLKDKVMINLLSVQILDFETLQANV